MGCSGRWHVCNLRWHPRHGRESYGLHGARGLSLAGIGGQRVMSQLFETHRSSLIHKLDLNTQADLIRYALRRGIIPMED